MMDYNCVFKHFYFEMLLHLLWGNLLGSVTSIEEPSQKPKRKTTAVYCLYFSIFSIITDKLNLKVKDSFQICLKTFKKKTFFE